MRTLGIINDNFTATNSLGSEEHLMKIRKFLNVVIDQYLERNKTETCDYVH